MALAPITHLSPDSQRQYHAVYDWFRTTYGGDMQHTEGIQQFIDNHPDAVVRTGLRGRILRSIVGRYLIPVPRGPSLRLHNRARERAKRVDGGKAKNKSETYPWLLFVPQYIHKSICDGAADQPPCADQNWMHWTHSFVYVMGAHALRRSLIRAYVAYVHRILRPLCPSGDTTAFLGVAREDIVHAMLHGPSSTTAFEGIPSPHATPLIRPNAMRLCRIAVNRFVTGVIFPDDAPCAACRVVRASDLGARAVTHRRGIPRVHPPLDATTHEDWEPPTMTLAARDHFTPAEVAAIIGVSRNNARDHTMLRIMSETGLRRRAVSWLTVDAVYDSVARHPLPVATAVEKGLAVRHFQLSESTRRVLGDYIENHLRQPYRWLFPSPCHGEKRPIGSNTVNSVLQRACRQAGISGRHVHSHAIRKFVVCQLMAAHNRVEDVAKWIGHRSVNITYQTYWDLNLQEVVEGMQIPWMLNTEESVVV